MYKEFHSKIGFGLVIPLIVVLVGVLTLSILEGLSWIGGLILLPAILFVLHMFLNTWYRVGDGKLEIKCGFFFHMYIEIASIKKIKTSSSPLSAPALSFDRLDISYGKFGRVLVSPKDKKSFLSAILELNPAIEIEAI